MKWLVRIAIFLIGKELVEDVLNGKKGLYLCDPITAMIIASVVVGGATVGTQMYAQRKAEKRQSSLLQFQEQQVQKAETKAATAETLATQRATETLKKRRRSITQTVFTTPLGLQDEATIGTRSLLGTIS